MLTITKGQMIRADAKARIHFHRRVRDHVREKMPEAVNTTPNTQLLAYIGEQDKIAAAHGIQTERGVTKWVCLSLDLGTDFYQKESIKDYFNPETPPDAETKLNIFVEFLNEKQNDPGLTIDTVIKKQGYHVVGG
jgi:hypothetical protein